MSGVPEDELELLDELLELLVPDEELLDDELELEELEELEAATAVVPDELDELDELLLAALDELEEEAAAVVAVVEETVELACPLELEAVAVTVPVEPSGPPSGLGLVPW